MVRLVDQLSSVIDAEARTQLKRLLVSLVDPVKVTLFTQTTPCQTCTEQRKLLEEVAAMSNKISLIVLDLQADHEMAKSRSVDKVPTTILDRRRNYNLRFYGLTAGYESSSLVDAILMVSTGVSSLDERLESLVKAIKKPVHIEIMTTLTCPYCPRMVHVANQFAVVNDKIMVDMIDSAEYPQLVQRYQVSGVPKTVINETHSFEGAIQAEAFYLEILKAEDPEQYRRLDEEIRESQGLRKVRRVEEGHHYEVLIVGGGPAGMNAALYSARKGRDAAMITSNIGGQIGYTASVENYLGFGAAPGFDVIDLFRRHLEAHKIAEGIGIEVVRVEATKNGFMVTTSTGKRYKGETLIYCAGKEYKHLEIPGETHFIGKGIGFCATCDAPIYTDKRVAVVGGGNSALTAARDLLRFASEVHLIHRGEALKADEELKQSVISDKKLTLHLKTTVQAFLGDDKLTGVRIVLGEGQSQDILVDGVFLEVGLIPNSAPLISLIELNERGEVPVKPDMSTSFPGLFAAGDVTNVKEKQIAISIGQGAQAAL